MHGLAPTLALVFVVQSPTTPQTTVDELDKLAATSTEISRRQFLLGSGAASVLIVAPTKLKATDLDTTIERVDAQFGYRLTTPVGWEEGGKPMKTHLHELLLHGPGSNKGRLKVGVTVDPVKINSLEEFGTFQEVTGRVLGVEAGRDGVVSVALRSATAEAGDATAGRPSYYTVEYVSTSKRGDMVFCCKYAIDNGRLYVVQAQSDLAVFNSDAAVRETLRGIISSFQVMGMP